MVHASWHAQLAITPAHLLKTVSPALRIACSAPTLHIAHCASPPMPRIAHLVVPRNALTSTMRKNRTTRCKLMAHYPAYTWHADHAYSHATCAHLTTTALPANTRSCLAAAVWTHASRAHILMKAT